MSVLFVLLLFVPYLSHSEVASSNSNALASFLSYEGESTKPTQEILNDLIRYKAKWESERDLFSGTYSMTFAWDCVGCSVCDEAYRFINVRDGDIESIDMSTMNRNDQYTICQHEVSNEDDFLSIDELYDHLITWIQDGLGTLGTNQTEPSGIPSSYLVMQLMLHKEYYFPTAVKLTKGDDFEAWEIICFDPEIEENEEDTCDQGSSEKPKPWSFWITKQMQSFIGWSMIFLILVACSLGYCINWLKKKKTEKIEAWREKEEKQRQEHLKEKKEQREKKRKSKQSKLSQSLIGGKKKKKKTPKPPKKPIHSKYSDIPVTSDVVSSDEHSDSSDSMSDDHSYLEDD